MKKFLTMLLIVAMALSITACAAEKKEKKASELTSDVASTAQAPISQSETSGNKADLEIKTSDLDAKTIYDEAARKNSKLTSIDAKSTVTTNMSGAETSDTKLDLDIKIADWNKESMRYLAVGSNTGMGETVEVSQYFEQGYYYDSYAGQKLKFARDPEDMMKRFKDSTLGAGFTSLDMKDITVKEDGDCQILTFHVEASKLDAYLDDLMSRMELDLDGVNCTVNEAYGEAVVNKDGFFIHTKFRLSLEITTRGNTSIMVKDMETSYNNPGQEVEVTPPDLEGYNEVEQ